MNWRFWLGLSCVLAALVANGAAIVRAEYTPPAGFNGQAWGSTLAGLGAVKLARANTATDSKGIALLRCAEKPEGCAGDNGGSDPLAEGRGSFAVAEYYRDRDNNPWAPALVALHSATYLFCDEWLGSAVRTDVKQRLKLCGARIFYRSDARTQNHDRLLRHLIREHGPPDGYRMRRGEITIGPVIEHDSGDPSGADPLQRTEGAPEPAQGITRYRWCGPADQGALLPDCTATITLLFNHDSGWGMVIFATDSVYRFAAARHATRDENNELYMALISRDPTKPTRRNANKCLRTTGSLICEGKLVAMPETERRRFEP